MANPSHADSLHADSLHADSLHADSLHADHGKSLNFDLAANQGQEPTLPGISEGEILVIRSTRRKRNISAYRQGGRIIVSIPARMSKADERAVVPEMVAKIREQEESRTPTESSLLKRTCALLDRLAPEITQRPISITWRSMRERWGSCTGVDRTIRISDRLKFAPDYALDYILFHEAIHLYHFDHGPEFNEILSRFEGSELASAYLAGYEAAERALAAPQELKKLRTIAG